MKVPPVRTEKQNILMIDDDRNFCNIYKSLLEDTGRYSVTTACSGKEGLMLAKTKKPDLILLDVLMPTMDGGDVACLLSCNASTKDIPYIFITCLVKPHENSINNRHHYLGKPVALQDLISAINEVTAYQHELVYS